MSVLCIAAHPDDEVLGVGGTLVRHVVNGDDVHVCILSDGVTSRYENNENAQRAIVRRRESAQQACDILGVSVSFYDFPDNSFDTVPLLSIIRTLETEISQCNPDIIYTHHYGDLNVDHKLACQATMTATRPLSDSPVERVVAFETLSSTEWSVPDPGNVFNPTLFVDISEYIETKIDALSVYETELSEESHPRTIEIVRKNAEVWGSKMGTTAAEPFEVLREVRR